MPHTSPTCFVRAERKYAGIHSGAGNAAERSERLAFSTDAASELISRGNVTQSEPSLVPVIFAVASRAVMAWCGVALLDV